MSLAPAADTKPEHGFVERTCRGPDRKEARYYVFVPYDYKGDKPYPLIVFLHGSGETGTDGKRAIAEPERKLTASEVKDRVSLYYGCEHVEPLKQKVA